MSLRGWETSQARKRKKKKEPRQITNFFAFFFRPFLGDPRASFLLLLPHPQKRTKNVFLDQPLAKVDQKMGVFDGEMAASPARIWAGICARLFIGGRWLIFATTGPVRRTCTPPELICREQTGIQSV